MKQLTTEIYAYLEKYSVNDYSIEISYKFGTGNIKLIWEIDYIRCEIFIFDNQIGLVEELLNQKFEMIKSILIYNLKK